MTLNISMRSYVVVSVLLLGLLPRPAAAQLPWMKPHPDL